MLYHLLILHLFTSPVVGLMLCHQYLQEAQTYDLWKMALQSGYIVQLCRDEVLHIHSYIIAFFESMKG